MAANHMTKERATGSHLGRPTGNYLYCGVTFTSLPYNTDCRSPMVTGTSVLGVKFNGGVVIAADTLGSYGSLARYRTVSRLLRVNDTTVMGSGGDYADFQFIKSVIEQRVIEEECLDDGFQYTPKALFSWLTRVYYNRRSRMNPLWNTTIVAGLQPNGTPFLGYVDKIGTAYEAPSVASGYGAYIAQPLLREGIENNPHMSEKDAKTLIDRCLKVLFYRDARSWNRYELAVVTTGQKAYIEGPLSSKTEWSIAHTVGNVQSVRIICCRRLASSIFDNMAEFNGSWALVSSENFEAYITAIGVSAENREKALKLLQTTGDGGLVEKHEVDLTANTVKRSIYFGGKLFKEAPSVPLNQEVDGQALDERPIKVKVTIEGTNRLIRHETGADYTATIVAEVNGDTLSVTLTTGSGVTSVRTYKKV